MKHNCYPEGIERSDLIQWFREGRSRSRELFEIPEPDRYYHRPIPLRNPIIFYEGHLPAFAINTLAKLALSHPGIDPELEVLFARGIDPEFAVSGSSDGWPSREVVQRYAAAADALLIEMLSTATVESDAIPALRNGEAAIGILEHEEMHQETLLYMFHNLSLEQKRRRPPLHDGGEIKARQSSHGGNEWIAIPAGAAQLGTRDDGTFGWDNEFMPAAVDVPPFEIQRFNVTNGEYLEFVTSASAEPSHFWTRKDGNWYWRGMFDEVPLPLDWPVYVTHTQATAYARWKGWRLPTEAEYDRAAYGSPGSEDRRFPWGDAQPEAHHGNFDFRSWDPVPVGSYPAGASAWGVEDLAGNGWEWTSSFFEALPGFQPMASYSLYSAEFFDRQHFVLKGASPATSKHLIRRGLRNWFRPNYPYVYATFRCVRPAESNEVEV